MPFKNRIILLLVLSLPACASVQTPAPSTGPSAAYPIHLSPGQMTYTIKKGETLWHIARTHQVDLEDLARLNKIADATQIASGQIIVLPAGAHAPSASPNFADTSSAEFIWPAKGKVLAYFQQKSDGTGSKGITIAMQSGQDVIASRGGRVAFVGNIAGYGSTIIISHPDGFSSVYCGPQPADVKLNDDIAQGTIIGKAGAFPRVSGDALHFEIRKRHKPMNPLFFLD